MCNIGEIGIESERNKYIVVIDDQIISMIEKALNVRLYEEQRAYLKSADNYYWLGGRGSGHTLAHCIALALSDGEPLDMRQPHEFSDYGNGTRAYAKDYYRRMFLEVWNKLSDCGFPVRKGKCDLMKWNLYREEEEEHGRGY